MPTVNETVADAMVGRGVDLLRLEANTQRVVLGFLVELEQDLVAALRASELDAIRGITHSQRRLAQLLDQVRGIIEDAYQAMGMSVRGVLTDLGLDEQDWMVAALNEASGLPLIDAALTAASLTQLVDAALVEGAPSAEWWSRQAGWLRDAFADQVRMGMAAGESIEDMVRRIRGSATGRRQWYYRPGTDIREMYVQFSGGIMDTGTRQARAMVRTSVQQVLGDTRRSIYQANTDTIKGITQHSTLDNRTSVTCVAYAGASWSLPDYEPINGTTLPYAGGTPRHWGCRSVEIPVMRSWRELGIDLDEAPAGTRSSMDGQVPADMTMAQWLRGKPDEFVDAMLGKGKADLWRSGAISLTDLVDQSGRPLSLREITARRAA